MLVVGGRGASGQILHNIESLRASARPEPQTVPSSLSAQQKQGPYLVVDPVEESRHHGKQCGLQSLHVIRQQPNISLEEPNSGSTRVHDSLEAKPRDRAHVGPVFKMMLRRDFAAHGAFQ